MVACFFHILRKKTKVDMNLGMDYKIFWGTCNLYGKILKLPSSTNL